MDGALFGGRTLAKVSWSGVTPKGKIVGVTKFNTFENGQFQYRNIEDWILALEKSKDSILKRYDTILFVWED